VAAMDWREYIWFVIIAFFAFLIGGVINQILGISGSQNPVTQAIAFLIPVTILFYAYHRLRRR
jgi:UDP-N-acetylmuramyl pentapeptide phosphotransferase/UDP-N-acetylglucosamine-1-phosphate transferase